MEEMKGKIDSVDNVRWSIVKMLMEILSMMIWDVSKRLQKLTVNRLVMKLCQTQMEKDTEAVRQEPSLENFVKGGNFKHHKLTVFHRVLLKEQLEDIISVETQVNIPTCGAAIPTPKDILSLTVANKRLVKCFKVISFGSGLTYPLCCLNKMESLILLILNTRMG